MSVDPENGILYLPVSSPSPNFFGGNRTETLPLATSVTALDADTGKVMWSRQLVHHDIWDYDTNFAAGAGRHRQGRADDPGAGPVVEAGFLYVLNRLTGEPIYPIEEKPVPQSDIPGEKASPTQPYVGDAGADGPRRGRASSTSPNRELGYCSRKAARCATRAASRRRASRARSTYPATAGGDGMGRRRGRSDDQHLCRQQLERRADLPAHQARGLRRREQDGKKRLLRPERALPTASTHNFVNWLGMPCWKPPYGTLPPTI